MNDIKGSDQQEQILKLLSKTTNKSTPESNITEIDGFISKDHIGFKFIKKNVRKFPAKSKVIDIDEEIDKGMIQYVHRGYEWVEPNIIQKALLYMEQDDFDGDFFTFGRILNQCTVDSKIEVELL